MLKDEIDSRSKDIISDSYAMSLGEIISMYQEGDLDIHPEFQRFFRWTLPQKTKLIESFLLGIPVPSIFVSQKDDGVWDIIDGLQRLSTIFEFVGVYKDENGEKTDPLQLIGTKLLPSLEGKFYNNSDNPENSFTETERRYLKRAKLNIVIVKKQSDSTAKYEMFQRLNTGGTQLSDQEVRNCLMVMNDKDKFIKVQEMANYSNFKDILRISDKAFLERFDMELVTRFLCLRTETQENIGRIQDFGEYLDDRIIYLFGSPDFNIEEEINIFKRTFDFINEKMGDEAFSKYDNTRQKFIGTFYTSAFEIIAIGLSQHLGCINPDFNLREKVQELWIHIKDNNISWKGSNPSRRILKMIDLAKLIYEEI